MTVEELKSAALAPPQTINAILQGSWAVRTLKTACDIAVFETLKDGPLDAASVAAALDMPLTGIGLMLDSLVGMKLLEREDLHAAGGASPIARSQSNIERHARAGVPSSISAAAGAPGEAVSPVAGALAQTTGPVDQSRGPGPVAAGQQRHAIYALTSEAKLYLLKESTLYMGAYLRQDEELNKMWRSLKETITTGKPVMEVNQDDRAEEIFPQLAESIMPLNYAIACDVVRYLKCKRDYFCEPLLVLDLACGAAPWSIPFAQQSAYTKIDALDFPAVLTVTKKMAETFGVAKQIRCLPGNWRDVKVEPAHYDVAILGHILHSEGLERSKELIAYCYQALQPGGALIIAEFMTNREHTGPLHSLLFGLNMYLATTNGCVFSLEQLKQMCISAGFGEVIRHSGIGYDSPVVLAFK
jgi:ubiquinone/menaquinone biosynthesis C-methylase UbiE